MQKKKQACVYELIKECMCVLHSRKERQPTAGLCTLQKGIPRKCPCYTMQGILALEASGVLQHDWCSQLFVLFPFYAG